MQLSFLFMCFPIIVALHHLGPNRLGLRLRGGGKWVGGGVLTIIYHRPSHPYNAGTEQVVFSPTTQTLLAPSAKRRDMLGEAHEV